MAARAWKNGGLTTGTARPALPGNASLDDAIADAELFGIDPQIVQDRLDAGSRRLRETFKGVWPMHHRAALLFVAAANQWRIFQASFLSIDYAAAEIAWKRLGLLKDARPEDFAAFQHIEAEACRLLNGGGNA